VILLPRTYLHLIWPAVGASGSRPPRLHPRSSDCEVPEWPLVGHHEVGTDMALKPPKRPKQPGADVSNFALTYVNGDMSKAGYYI
jgi:hypothetical protein